MSNDEVYEFAIDLAKRAGKEIKDASAKRWSTSADDDSESLCYRVHMCWSKQSLVVHSQTEQCRPRHGNRSTGRTASA